MAASSLEITRWVAEVLASSETSWATTKMRSCSQTPLMAAGLLLVQSTFVSPQNTLPPSLASATELIITATTGGDPVVTFMPSQNPNYTTITQTVTTTNQYNQSIIILPFGIIWAPVPPVPPVPPQIPIETVPSVPTGDGENPCSTFSMSGCTVTVTYTSQEDTGWTRTETDECTQVPTVCELPFVEATSTITPEPTPWAEVTALPDDTVPKPAPSGGPNAAQWFKDMFKRLGIDANEGIPDPVCHDSELGAPREEDNGWDGVGAAVDRWCQDLDGDELAPAPNGVDTAFERNTFYHHSFWLSARYRYGSPFECGDKVTISPKECVQVLTNAMAECDGESKSTHGVSGFGDCIVYNITMAKGMDDASPPWDPLPSPKCDGSTSEVARNFVEALSEVFCEAAKDTDQDNFSKVLTRHDIPSSSSSSSSSNLAAAGEMTELRKRAPPPSPESYDGYEFEFTWDAAGDDDVPPGGCRIECGDAYRRLGQECGRGGWQGANMRDGGSMDAGCGAWSYKITPPPDPSDDDVTATKPPGPAKCYKAKSDKCAMYDAQPWIAHDKSDTFCDDHADYSMYPSWEGLEDSSKDFMKDIGWYWKVVWKAGCQDADESSRNLAQPIDGFSCKDAMRMAFDGCTGNKGRGGMVEVGCIEYHFNPTSRSTLANIASECDRPRQEFE